MHFGNVPFENFISFQKGNLLIYIILVLIFFVYFLNDQPPLFNTLIVPLPRPQGSPSHFYGKALGTRLIVPITRGRGWGGGGAVYTKRSGLCVRHFVSFGLRRLATDRA